MAKLSPEKVAFLLEAGLPVPVHRDRPSKVPYHDFNAVVTEFVTLNGGSMEDVIIDLFQSAMLASRCGDTTAIKFLVERLCGKQLEEISMDVTEVKLSPTERQARVEAILAPVLKRLEGKQ